MKKLIALTFALAFLCATGIASAADISMSGDYFVSGTYLKNVYGTGEISGVMNYDHEFNLNANWSIDDNTVIYTQFEMRDETWGSSNPKEGTTLNGTIDAELDDNFIVEKVYVWHKFANGHQLRAGLMPSGAWGTAFGNTGSEAYRLRYDIPVNADTTILGILQKNSESGSDSTGVGESDDSDTYYLGMLTKVGNINVAPVIVYTNGGNTSDSLTGIVSLNGDFGNIGFEAETGVKDVNYDDSTKDDTRVYGAYLNIWNQSGPVKAGILGAYGSYDDNTTTDAAYSFGDDFYAGGAQIIGDYLEFDFVAGNYGLDAGRLVALYADYAVNAQLSVGAYAGYAKCGADTNDKWDGADVWEVSGDAAYKITDNITYDMGAAVAQLKWGDSTADPDKAYRVFHRMTVNF